MALDIASFVIKKLTDPVLQEASLLYNVAGKVASVKKKLEWIKVSLEDAEKKGKRDETVNLWVDQVREVSFRIEDAIDIYLLELKGDHTPEADRTNPTHGGCRSFGFIRWFYKILKKPVALHNLGVELNDIEAPLKEINENKQSFNINDPDGSSSQGENPSIKRCYEFPDIEIVGLQNEKKAIIQKLINPQAQKLNVISIVGTGGLGKTTLARKVFHSTEVANNFDKKIWISVSREFDKTNILKTVLENFRTINQEEKDQDQIYFIRKIKSCFKKKKILLVLDDIWSEGLWPDIKMICSDDMERCGVLITTRKLDVAKKAQSEPYKLEFLNLEESKKLLYKVSFPKEESPKGLDLAATEIAEIRGGLPLAIVVVGGRLYKENKYSEWNKVAKSINWLGNDRECMQILATSYEDMSSNLKTCFIYLASFPEDYKIDAKSLLRTWVAEGLASDEETAENYLQELAQRSLVIVTEKAYDGSIETFWVHDLLLELAIEEAKKMKFLSVFAKQIPEKTSFNNARRASLQSCNCEERNSDNIENEREAKKKYIKKIRSLLVFNESWSRFYLNKSLPDDLLGLRLLKVLKLERLAIHFSSLEQWCEELINLRHLELRDCNVLEKKEIPNNIGHLENLITLDCTATDIDRVPESLWSIKTLRHVLMNATKVPQPSADLPNLRTLCNVELKPSSSSSNPTLDDGSYHFSNLRELDLRDVQPWVATLLKVPKQLVYLRLENNWSSGSNNIITSDILDMTGFPWYQSLQCLVMLAKWPGHFELQAHLFPPNLTELYLLVPSFGKDPLLELGHLQYLESLMLVFDFGTGELFKTLTCSSTCFPQLQELSLHYFHGEEFCIIPGAMPMLKRLGLYNFDRMKNIPELQHLTMLQEFYWYDAPYSDEEIQAMKEKDHAKLQHISSVIICKISCCVNWHT